MPITIEQFRVRLAKYSREELERTMHNCVQQGRTEFAQEVKDFLDAHYPGWNRPRTRRGGSRQTIARFRDQQSKFESARAAYIWLVECFSKVNPQLFTDVRWETTGFVAVGKRRSSAGATRNYFARTPEKLFLRTPSLADDHSNYHRLTNSWYVNLNLNTRENYDILCRFAAVSKLSHGNEWDWEVLDPTDELSDSRRRVQLAADLMKELDQLFPQTTKTET